MVFCWFMIIVLSSGCYQQNQDNNNEKLSDDDNAIDLSQKYDHPAFIAYLVFGAYSDPDQQQPPQRSRTFSNQCIGIVIEYGLLLTNKNCNPKNQQTTDVAVSFIRKNGSFYLPGTNWLEDRDSDLAVLNYNHNLVPNDIDLEKIPLTAKKSSNEIKDRDLLSTYYANNHNLFKSDLNIVDITLFAASSCLRQLDLKSNQDDDLSEIFNQFNSTLSSSSSELYCSNEAEKTPDPEQSRNDSSRHCFSLAGLPILKKSKNSDDKTIISLSGITIGPTIELSRVSADGNKLNQKYGSTGLCRNIVFHLQLQDRLTWIKQQISKVK